MPSSNLVMFVFSGISMERSSLLSGSMTEAKNFNEKLMPDIKNSKPKNK